MKKEESSNKKEESSNKKEESSNKKEESSNKPANWRQWFIESYIGAIFIIILVAFLLFLMLESAQIALWLFVNFNLFNTKYNYTLNNIISVATIIGGFSAILSVIYELIKKGNLNKTNTEGKIKDDNEKVQILSE